MLKVAVLGASGYVGAELTQILAVHPHISALQLFHSGGEGSSGEKLGVVPFHTFAPKARALVPQTVTPFSLDALASDLDAVFLCTPHELSAELTPALLKKANVVIDLSAGFRFADAEVYPKHYKFSHPNPQLLAQAIYGLPELASAGLEKANVIGCAGCYVTAATLALAPLVQAGLLRSDVAPVISAVSGVSGAGRKAAFNSSFCEVSLAPYGVHNHRHQPEIEKNLGVPVVFTPHLGNFKRGILASIYAFTNQGVTAADVDGAFQKAYNGQPLVRLLGAGAFPAVQQVELTPFCDIGWSFDSARKQVSIFSALDNLLKGAASQSVQCFNLRFGLPMTTGLLAQGVAV
jgi:N-acetyl-gamma-glutamyl-phosphate reductase